jgi:hypothetical protein
MAVDKTSSFKTINFIQQFVRVKNLFKKFDYRNKSSTKGTLSKLVYLKNYVFSLPPSYMEVSYRMFLFVIYKLSNNTSDITVPFNRRGLKSILSTPGPRILN